MTARLSVNRLCENLGAGSFGRSILFTRETESTNKLAKKLAASGAAEGTVVVAGTQTKGRGRLCRKWSSPPGGLWFSVVLRPRMRHSETVGIVFAAGLGVAQVLRGLWGLEAETKWPNDVLVNGRKICGILAEARTVNGGIDFVVVGVGINANFEVEKALPKELHDAAASIEGELGKKVSLEALLGAVLGRLEENCRILQKVGLAPVLAEWKKYAAFLGQEVEVATQTAETRGVAVDVDSEGMLVLELEDGTRQRIIAGDVSLHVGTEGRRRH